MTLNEALATGRKFKRTAAADWYNLKVIGNIFSIEDLKAADYFTEDCPVKETVTLADLEKAFAAVNLSPPGIGRAAFRELVRQLCGVVIK